MNTYQNLIDNFIEQSRHILGDNLIGIYLHGSAVMGCFNPKKSDIDLILVVRDEVKDTVKRQFMDMVTELNKQAPEKGLELSIVREAVCKPFVYPTPFELHFSVAHLNWYQTNPEDYVAKMKGTDKDLAAHFTIIYHRGQVLYGKDIREVFAEVNREAYMDSIWCDIEGAVEDILDSPMYVILNLCRVLGYKEEGLILSKKEGGEWMLGKLAADEWRAVEKPAGVVCRGNEERNFEGLETGLCMEKHFAKLIADAMEEYATGQKMKLQETVAKRFGEYMLERINDQSKPDLLFYDAYEEFYKMAAGSPAFQAFCKDAFGEDFSQDGFSDITQINRILEYVSVGEDVHILDIGCGNGKMLGYLQQKTGAYIHGFDYSGEAIKTAKELFAARADFREGIIGEVDYEENSFDVITSMDTMYFAKDMPNFVAQVKKWLKKDGVFFVGYQEGDVMPKTESAETTELAKALRQNGFQYEVTDITRQTYELLRKKREAALVHREQFMAENLEEWFDLLLFQTECATESYEEFARKMARYLFVVRK